MEQGKEEQRYMAWQDVKWIGLPDSEISRCNILQGDMTGRFVYFVHVFRAEEGMTLKVNISANSRYRLWLNGEPICAGPEKGNLYRYYYDTAELTPYLKEGENIVAVQVLYQCADDSADGLQERSAIYGVVSPGGGHRLAVEGRLMDGNGQCADDLTTGTGLWRCYLDGTRMLVNRDCSMFFLGATAEDIDFAEQPGDWKNCARISENWVAAEEKESVIASDGSRAVGFVERMRLQERDIPLLYQEEDKFLREMTQTGIIERGSITVKKGESIDFVLDAGYVKNTFPTFGFRGGKGTRVIISYFEKYAKEGQEIARDDTTGVPFIGLEDRVVLDGTSVVFEPFWHRTFRFLRIQVEGAEEETEISLPKYLRTGYPLSIESAVESSDPWVKSVYEMCVRTLESCMTETYMDCPLYEQLQYPMDTRLQILFNYTVSGDYRLVRKAIRDFHDAILPCGLLPGKAPTAYLQIISTFSLHYLFILWEYYEQTKDLSVLKEYRSDLDRILDYYDRKIEADTGLVGWPGFWPFVDWKRAWNESAGSPVPEGEGPSTIINLMYGYALLTAAKIAEVTGRPGVAEEYRARQEKICTRVRELCYDEERGMYRETIGKKVFSQHAQSWAVLNGMARGEEAALLMERAVGESDMIHVSFSTSYEFFRALEKCGRYNLTRAAMEKWIRLVDLHCGTCPETPDDARSECHAWSALPIYELFHGIAGIRQAGIGWERIVVEPHLSCVPDLRGKFVTPKGTILFDYRQADGRWVYEIVIPEDTEAEFIFPDGARKALSAGRNVL